jgi:hypothetical protein
MIHKCRNLTRPLVSKTIQSFLFPQTNFKQLQLVFFSWQKTRTTLVTPDMNSYSTDS